MALITWETRSTDEHPLRKLAAVFQIEGGVDLEIPAGDTLLGNYRQRSGITARRMFDTILAILESHGHAPALYDNLDGMLAVANYKTYLDARSKPSFDVSCEGLRCEYRTHAARNFSVLNITQFENEPILAWADWAAALAPLPGFAQAILMDEAYDLFQNATFLSVHTRAGRSVDGLVLEPAEEGTLSRRVNTSRNPGRRRDGYGYLEAVGSTMWLGQGFWRIAGKETKRGLLDGEWPEAVETDGGVLRVLAAPRCFADGDDPEVQYRLRELVYAKARANAGKIGEELHRQAETRRTAMQAKRDRLEILKKETSTKEAADAVEPIGKELPAAGSEPQRSLRKRILSFFGLAARADAVPQFGPGSRRDPGPAAAIPPMPPYTDEYPCEGFGYKMAWLAVSSGSTAQVALALGLREPEWTPWAFGVEMAYAFGDNHVAATPPIGGWVLVAGSVLFPRAEDRGMLSRLSRRFGEVQVFATHRVSESHFWARWLDGVMTRSVTHTDGETTQSGGPTDVETDLLVPIYQDNAAHIDIDEETVMQVAAAWSVAPSGLDCEQLRVSHMLTGRLL